MHSVLLDWRLYVRALRAQAHSNTIALVVGTLLLMRFCGDAFSLGKTETASVLAQGPTLGFAAFACASFGTAVVATWLSNVTTFLRQLRVSLPEAFPPGRGFIAVLLFGRHLLPVAVALSPFCAYCLGASPDGNRLRLAIGVLFLAWSAATIAFLLIFLSLRVSLVLVACALFVAMLCLVPTSLVDNVVARGLVQLCLGSRTIPIVVAALVTLVLALTVRVVATLSGQLDTVRPWMDTARAGRVVSSLLGHLREPYLRREILLAMRWPRLLTMIVFALALPTLVAYRPARLTAHPELLLLAVGIGPLLLSTYFLNSFAIEGPGLVTLILPRFDLERVFAAKERVFASLCVLTILPAGLLFAFKATSAPPVWICALVASAFVSYCLATGAAGRLTSLMFPQPVSAFALSGDLLPPPSILVSMCQVGLFIGVPAFLLSRSNPRPSVPACLALSIILLALSSGWRVLARAASRSLLRVRLENLLELTVGQARGARAGI